MKKVTISFAIVCISIVIGFSKSQTSSRGLENTTIANYDSTMRQDLLCLMMGYPDFIRGIEKNINGKVYLVMKSGKKILYDDRKAKNLTQKLNDPDLEDMLEQIYPLSGAQTLQNKDFDPGRRRVRSFFEEIYGGSQKAVQTRLAGVKIANSLYSFNSNAGASNALRNVMKILVPMSEKQKSINQYVFPVSGTFNYRVIAGTNQLSGHAYAIAIDLAANKGGGGYWRWVSINDGKSKIIAYPQQIVKIFEKNNFIWGGKWWHFDIMHFEYRPELILKAKYFSSNAGQANLWYYRFPYKDKTVKKYITMINKALKEH